jgi:hypothetical protein
MGAALQAQGTDAAIAAATRTRLNTLLQTAPGTPSGKSLVGVALADAQVALAQAALAKRAPTDLAAMQAAAGNILHALDPTLVKSGPASGYGARRAIADVIAQIETTASADRKADVSRITPRALAAARAAQTAAESLVKVAQQVREAPSAEVAASLTDQAYRLAEETVAGTRPRVDRAPTGPGGLLAVQAHLVGLAVGRMGEVPASLKAAARTEVAR